MRETTIKCDICKQVISTKDLTSDEEDTLAVEIGLFSNPLYLKRYYTDIETETWLINWPEVCDSCRKHLAKRLAEAINEIWKEE